MILGYSTLFNVAQEVAVARESRVNVTVYRLEIASDASYVLRSPLTPTPPRCIRLWEWVIFSMFCYFTNRTLLVLNSTPLQVWNLVNYIFLAWAHQPLMTVEKFLVRLWTRQCDSYNTAVRIYTPMWQRALIRLLKFVFSNELFLVSILWIWSIFTLLLLSHLHIIISL